MLGTLSQTLFYALPGDLKDAPDTLAKEGFDKIAKLFATEKEIEDYTAEEKVKVRQEKSRPLIDDFFSWCQINENRVLIRLKLGKAISYAMKYEKGLRLYLKDGYVPMTNSLDERTIMPFIAERRNWMFLSSTKGAEASEAAFSLIKTAKANHLGPHDYIEYLLEIMPNMDFMKSPEKLDDFLLWSKQTQSIF